MVKDFIKHAFTNKPNDLNMMKGFTPFCLQPMTQASQVSLRHLQEEMDEAKTMSQNNVNKHNSMQKYKLIKGELKFLNLSANTTALSQVLFMNALPLTKGLQELQEIVANGHHEGDLAILEQFQPDWFTQILWGLYECIDKFFQQKLSKEDLQRGARMANPLDYFNTEVQQFSEYCHPKCPPSILQKPPQDNNNGQETTKPRKQPGLQTTRGGWCRNTKKQQNQPEGQKQFNLKYDGTLRATKQAIIQQHGCINLGLLIQANSTMTPSTLSALGLQTTSCGQYKFWGVCGNPACKLKHDDTSLRAMQMATVSSIMVEGAKKLQMPKAQQN